MSQLSGKVAIVTGASKGIGAAIAKSLAANGASVIVNYASSREGADKVVAAITASGGKAVAVKGDVAKAADAKAIVDAAIKTYGKLDVLVNNAGIYDVKPLEEITEEHYHQIFDINVLGLLLVSQAAAKHLPAGGSIVNIGSLVSRITPPGMAVYNGTKGAVDAITGTLSKELAPRASASTPSIPAWSRPKAPPPRASSAAISRNGPSAPPRWAGSASRTISPPS
jgi:3-oxoacyl-[acyl-carrier protein] reductase